MVTVALKKYALLPAAIIFSFLCVFGCGPAAADMTLMGDNELSEVTATGFSKFTLTEGVTDIARIDLNLGVATYTEVGAMQMGHWDKGAGLGWDQNWQSVSFGSDATDLVLNDFVVEAQFTDINDSATRQLQSLTVGFSDVTGTISTDFGTFSGSIQGVNHDRAALGPTTVVLKNEPFLMTLHISNGVSFTIGW